MSENEYQEAGADLEKEALNIFPLDMVPEEYAAREGHGWACCSFISYRYANPTLDHWMREFEKYLTNYDLLKEARRKYLSPDEIRKAEEYENYI